MATISIEVVAMGFGSMLSVIGVYIAWRLRRFSRKFEEQSERVEKAHSMASRNDQRIVGGDSDISSGIVDIIEEQQEELERAEKERKRLAERIDTILDRARRMHENGEKNGNGEQHAADD